MDNIGLLRSYKRVKRDNEYLFVPKNMVQLCDAIDSLIEEYGINADLNCINTSYRGCKLF